MNPDEKSVGENFQAKPLAFTKATQICESLLFYLNVKVKLFVVPADKGA